MPDPAEVITWHVAVMDKLQGTIAVTLNVNTTFHQAVQIIADRVKKDPTDIVLQEQHGVFFRQNLPDDLRLTGYRVNEQDEVSNGSENIYIPGNGAFMLVHDKYAVADAVRSYDQEGATHRGTEEFPSRKLFQDTPNYPSDDKIEVRIRLHEAVSDREDDVTTTKAYYFSPTKMIRIAIEAMSTGRCSWKYNEFDYYINGKKNYQGASRSMGSLEID
jgi:hypothetical protein